MPCLAPRRTEHQGEAHERPPPTFLHPERWQGRAYFGAWQTTEAGAIDVDDPATGTVIASVGLGGAADIARAAAAARAAQRAWAKTLPTERARILTKAADFLEQNGPELIPWIMRESGSIYPKAAIEIEHGAHFIRHAATLAVAPMGMMIPAMDARTNYAKRVPHGVVGVISPFIFPWCSRSARSPLRSPSATRSCTSPIADADLRRHHHRPHLRGGRPAGGRAPGGARRR